MQHLHEEEQGADPDEEGNRVSLVSAKEERDLQTLLDKFTVEVHDLADFQQRLQNELTSLEVHLLTLGMSYLLISPMTASSMSVVDTFHTTTISNRLALYGKMQIGDLSRGSSGERRMLCPSLLSHEIAFLSLRL